MADLSPELIRSLISYDPDTGEMLWKPRPTPDGFRTERGWKIWTTRCSGRPALSSVEKQGYLYGRIGNKWVYAHRAAWCIVHGEWPDGLIDHINHRRDDNRIENLRVVCSFGNTRNISRPATNITGVVGVHWNTARRKWIAAIGKSGGYLGAFSSFEEAVRVRRAAERERGYHENHGTEAAR